MKEKKISDTFSEIMEREGRNFSKDRGYNLFNVYEVLSKNGMLVKSKYPFPLLDTIGKTFHEKTQFSKKED